MDKETNRPAAMILAAGFSERMGKPKHQLRFSLDETFLEHIVKVYKRFVVSDLVVVVNDTAKVKLYEFLESVRVVINQNPEYGRFHSIQLGLKEIENKNVFIQNIDNPFVNAGLLLELYHAIHDADFVVPVHENRGGHPILLSSEITEKVKTDFNKSINFKDVLKSFIRKNVVVNDPYISVNINTPEDYQKYFSGLM